MRDLLFRAKTLDKGEWVYGGVYVYSPTDALIIHRIGNNLTQHTMVDPKTIGQFTGKIINKEKLFEGDVIQVNGTQGAVGDIQFQDTIFGIEWLFSKEDRSMEGSWGQCHNLRRIDDHYLEQSNSVIIGNIHDNPELFKWDK